LLHYDNELGWVDVTHDDVSSDGLACGRVDHFSPFAITQLVDAQPPVITVLGTPMLVVATSAAGAPVAFTVTAVDDVAGTVPVACNPQSGTAFAIGTTTVTCTAGDGNGNTATASFTVRVTNDVKDCKRNGWRQFSQSAFANQGKCVEALQ
jgi:hypothetical protein